MKSQTGISVVYDSARRGSVVFEELHEVLNYRFLILQLVRRDILTRYKRSFLGVAWTMLNPLGMMLVWTIAFSQFFKAGDLPSYPAYVLSGLLAWNFFSQTTTSSMVNLVWGGGLLNRIYIPRTSFAIAAIGTGLVNIVLSMVPLIGVMLVTGVSLHWAILFTPIPVIILTGFALGVGLLLSTLAVYFPDVAEMYQIILMGWMFLTPVMYPITILPEAYRSYLTMLNPMYHFVTLFRIPIYFGRLPTLGELIIPVSISIFFLLLGWVIFTRKSDEFSYRI
jgi:ABC-type polysaccharide/polyol phosphate export permease